MRNFVYRFDAEGQNTLPAKFSWRWLNPLLSYGDLTASKMASVRYLEFLKVRNFKCQHSSGQYTSPCQISCRSVKPFPIYDHFSIIQDGGGPASWSCFTRFWTIHEEHFVVFVTVQNLVGFCAVVSIICRS